MWAGCKIPPPLTTLYSFIQEIQASKLLDEYILSGEIAQKDTTLAVACTLAFVQANWTGPLPPDSFPDLTRGESLKFLQVGGEAVYPLVRFPWLLVLAKAIFSNLDGYEWWYMRVLYLNQRILDNPSSVLAEAIEDLIKKYGDSMGVATKGESFVEAALMAQVNGNQKLSEDLLESACKLGEFSHHLTGVLGRRTKFQSFDIAQLTVKVKGKEASTIQEPTNNLGLVNVELDDEYLLDRPNLNESLPSDISKVGLCILLAECSHVLRFYAKDATIAERAGALIQRVLDHPGEWCIYSSALSFRSFLESSRARMVERAALQYQALVDQLKSTDIPFEQRIPYFFSTPLQPDWELDRQQAKLFACLGAFRTAATIFERRELWDEQISCLIQVGERSRAEELLVKKLEEDPLNFKMLCVLGELKNDHTLYMKAWELSNKKCARAMRSLGMHYVRNDQLTLAIEAFEAALALNSLFEKIWFLVGCLAMQLDEWKKALNAFSRTVALDPENGEAWNNLAAVHLQLGRQEEALRALKEAAKRNFDNWKIWDNVFRVAFTLGDIIEAISAYRRVSEIRGKETSLENLDYILETLRSLVSTHGLGDPQIASIARQLAALLNDILATHLSMDPQFWFACARYADITKQPIEKLEFYFKAYRAMQNLNVEHERDALSQLVKCVKQILLALDEVRTASDETMNIPEREYQIRTIIDNLIRRVQPTMGDTIEFSELRSL